ncbi:AAA-ATPase [Clostridium sporogenes]|nr:putative AAA-ATPase family protein [Clostridium botulinum Prevot_594]KRU41705.1 AAA-ATPase [Clostridium sporogenes]OQP94377.1 AAA-ATPase [Clostridium sporogenes]OQP98653.1 AAA-ATPase [Clostridium sporogenes]SQB32057.1 putative AAA-ATPase [Clostridium sporogenes]
MLIQILNKYDPYNFFIRPRRFGKSLFISMLENYYDINKKDKFEELFGDLYIGKNPTEEKNSFDVDVDVETEAELVHNGYFAQDKEGRLKDAK